MALYIDGVRNEKLGFTLMKLSGLATIHSLASVDGSRGQMRLGLASRAGIQVGDQVLSCMLMAHIAHIAQDMSRICDTSSGPPTRPSIYPAPSHFTLTLTSTLPLPLPWHCTTPTRQVLAAHGHEFDSTYTCEDIVGTIGQHKPFVLLTLRRDRTHFNPVYVFKHPLAVALKDTQGMLEEREVFAVSAFIQRMKLRTLQWSTGLISGRAESLMRDYVSELELHDSFRLVAGDKVGCIDACIGWSMHTSQQSLTRAHAHKPLTLTLSLVGCRQLPPAFDPVAIRQVYHYKNPDGIFASVSASPIATDVAIAIAIAVPLQLLLITDLLADPSDPTPTPLG